MTLYGMTGRFIGREGSYWRMRNDGLGFKNGRLLHILSVA